MLRILSLCLLLALSACATLPEPQPVNAHSHELWRQQVSRLKPLDQWSIRGRVAVYVEEDVYNLGMSWQRRGMNSTLKLEASLGQGLIKLEKNENSVQLTTAEGESVHGHNAQQVLHETTGLLIPVEGLETWIKGIPHEQTDFRHGIDGDGNTRTLQQDGWHINYLDFTLANPQFAEQLTLPRRLYMKHGKLALKIVIDQWQNKPQQNQTDLFPTLPN